MPTFLIYEIKVAAALVVFYMFYRLMLRKETFHRFNRVVLVGTAVLAFLLPVFSAVRLAKFNVDTRQTTSFIGLPTPPMAIFMASLPLAFWQKGMLGQPVLNPYLCLGIVILFSVLMVCNRPFFSFKMKSTGWKGNEVRWIFLILAVAGFAVFRFVALPFILLGYILMSVLFYRP